MADLEALGRMRVVYSLPDMERAQVRRDVEYTRAAEEPLLADIYMPADGAADARWPAVLFISGDAPPDVMRAVGGKAAGQYVSWGQLAAASGLAAVVADHRWTEGYTKVREVARDVADLLTFVRAHGAELAIDAARLAIWTASGGPPYALSAALRDTPPDLRCLVSYYGVLDLQSAISAEDPPDVVEGLRVCSPVAYLAESAARMPPLLIARAGEDNPKINETVDRFVAEALHANAPIELLNHPQGQHAFDVLGADNRSRAIIRRTLDFLVEHLADS